MSETVISSFGRIGEGRNKRQVWIPPPSARYLRQIAVITPYTEFSFFYKAEEDKNNMRLVFR